MGHPETERGYVMENKDTKNKLSFVDKDGTTSGPSPFDSEHERLMREEFRRRMNATRNGDTSDIVRGK